MRLVAETGRYEHALRIADQHLERYPDDPDLIEFRAQVAPAAARARGNPAPSPGVGEHLPAIAHRSADPGRDFSLETPELALIWINPGTFLMSNPQDSDDDTVVTLSRGYWLGRTEVTQEQWQTLMEHLPSPSQFRGSDRPVERVAWVSAMEFCRKLTDRERAAGRLPAGYEYTLPTEAQWEYACRAGTTGPFAGDLDAMAWFAPNGDRQTHPVAQKQPNAWGLYDMHGNVWEWCADGYGGYPGGHVTDPMSAYDGPSAAMTRIIRGGGWGNFSGQCRSSYRGRMFMNYADSGTGFRIALAPLRQPPAAEK
jgi:formylglycine-generating enzyme required for sulfatase activity